MSDTAGGDIQREPIPNDARQDAAVDQGLSDDVHDSLTANGDDDASRGELLDARHEGIGDLPGPRVIDTAEADTSDVDRDDLDTTQGV